MRSAKLLGCEATSDAAKRISKSSRQTPRIANRLLRRVRDFAEVSGKNVVDEDSTLKVLEMLGVDELGLDHRDRELLRALIQKFQGGPVGLNTLSASLSEEEATIEDIYEPYLLQLGFLDRTPRGRIATDNAYSYLGLTPHPQPRLL